MVRLRFSEILVKFAILVTVLIVISVTVAADFMQYPDKPLEKSGGSGNFNDGRYTNYMKNGNAISGVNRCVNGYCGQETGHAIYSQWQRILYNIRINLWRRVEVAEIGMTVDI